MAVVNREIKINTRGETDIIDITDQIKDCLGSSKLKNGSITVFIPGSTAGLTTIEYEPGLIDDLKNLFEEIASKSKNYSHNLTWQDGNGYSHVRAALLGPSLSVPFSAKKLLLGTWQQIVLIDFDNRPRSRKVIVQIIGD